ncbi:hypothetical protein NL676_014706 [Syzygium grande]|nr:hypothetical protein NL676_014706 [Syzygium grande]
MRKAFALACALFISFALLFLPSTEARALFQKGAPMSPSRCALIRNVSCIPLPPPGCDPYRRQGCHPPAGPSGP